MVASTSNTERLWPYISGVFGAQGYEVFSWRTKKFKCNFKEGLRKAEQWGSEAH